MVVDVIFVSRYVANRRCKFNIGYFEGDCGLKACDAVSPGLGLGEIAKHVGMLLSTVQRIGLGFRNLAQ